MNMQDAHGVVYHGASATRRTDYLYRVSLKCLVRNKNGEVLVVKESSRTWWDLPGGGMDHGESIKDAIAREMKEEVNLTGDFTYRVIDVDEPALLGAHNFWQLRLVFAVTPQNMLFTTGGDGDAIAFKRPEVFASSESKVERRIYRYARLTAEIDKAQGRGYCISLPVT
ncbi:MAG TPA: NUDIX hydrolase [Candidatus Saccharimonadales bacterium]